MPARTIDWEAIHRRLAVAAAAISGGLSARSGRGPPHPRGARESGSQAARQAGRHERLEVLAFSLAGETYGVETCHVREVCQLKDLTAVPCTPPFVAGVMNLRGQILAIVDLRTLLRVAGPGPHRAQPGHRPRRRRRTSSGCSRTPSMGCARWPRRTCRRACPRSPASARGFSRASPARCWPCSTAPVCSRTPVSRSTNRCTQADALTSVSRRNDMGWFKNLKTQVEAPAGLRRHVRPADRLAGVMAYRTLTAIQRTRAGGGRRRATTRRWPRVEIRADQNQHTQRPCSSCCWPRTTRSQGRAANARCRESLAALDVARDGLRRLLRRQAGPARGRWRWLRRGGEGAPRVPRGPRRRSSGSSGPASWTRRSQPERTAPRASASNGSARRTLAIGDRLQKQAEAADGRVLQDCSPTPSASSSLVALAARAVRRLHGLADEPADRGSAAGGHRRRRAGRRGRPDRAGRRRGPVGRSRRAAAASMKPWSRRWRHGGRRRHAEQGGLAGDLTVQVDATTGERRRHSATSVQGHGREPARRRTASSRERVRRSRLVLDRDPRHGFAGRRERVRDRHRRERDLDHRRGGQADRPPLQPEGEGGPGDRPEGGCRFRDRPQGRRPRPSRA